MNHTIILKSNSTAKPNLRQQVTVSGWEELLGHCCQTEEEMKHYCATFDKLGTRLKVVLQPFDNGGFVVEDSTTIDRRRDNALKEMTAKINR